MKVSVISKEAHAKPLYSWLTANGYEVCMLGDNPTAIPSSTDVLVCRHRSCSHQASQLATTWSKKTGKPMFMENGLATISQRLGKLNASKPPKKSEPFQLDFESLEPLLEHAPGQTMSWLAGSLGVRTDTLFPDLREHKRFAEVSATLARTPVVEEAEAEVPTAPALAEMEDLAAIVLKDRSQDSFEVQLAVLCYVAEGAHDEEVLRSLLTKQRMALEIEEDVEPTEEAVEALPFEGLPPEESPMAGLLEPVAPNMWANEPSPLMEAFEALRQEVKALRAELQELKAPHGAVTLDDLMAAGAHISIEPRKDV